jgi:hypothetical protein
MPTSRDRLLRLSSLICSVVRIRGKRDSQYMQFTIALAYGATCATKPNVCMSTDLCATARLVNDEVVHASKLHPADMYCSAYKPERT